MTETRDEQLARIRKEREAERAAWEERDMAARERARQNKAERERLTAEGKPIPPELQVPPPFTIGGF